MWIFLSDAFLSVVADRDEPEGERLLVRARREGVRDPAYHDAAMRAWSAMHRYQQQQDR